MRYRAKTKTTLSGLGLSGALIMLIGPIIGAIVAINAANEIDTDLLVDAARFPFSYGEELNSLQQRISFGAVGGAAAFIMGLVFFVVGRIQWHEIVDSTEAEFEKLTPEPVLPDDWEKGEATTRAGQSMN